MRPRSNVLLVFVALLATLSLVTLRSIDVQYATNQLFFFVVGLVVYFLVSSLPVFWLRQLQWWSYAGMVGLLLITLLIGRATNGSTSWLRIGAFRLQASELAKPVLAVTLASALPVTNKWSRRRQVTFWSAAVLPIALILRQPDLGTTLVLGSGVGMLWLTTRPSRKVLLLLLSSAIIIAIFGWLFVLRPYQKDRIRTFLDPNHDPRGSGYNARQALIAVGSGGWWGRGLGKGLQSHLRFLPERQTDFLFAAYAEETGFMGSATLILLYAALFWYLLALARNLPDPTNQRTLLALTAMMLAQVAVNIGMNIGLAPITGITLPLMSLGGSSILATLIGFGIVESIRRSELRS